MKALKFTLPIIALMLLVSCSSVRVAADYDRQTNFNELKTYAFFKPGIGQSRNIGFRQKTYHVCH